MSNIFASIFTGFGAFFTGMFGGGHASTTPPMMHQQPNSAWESSTTAMRGDMAIFKDGVFGLVETINGTTLTIDGREGTSTATTTYSVDASNAKIIKGSAVMNGSATTTATISDISVGDHVVVEGTINSDDTITATTIIDGMFMNGGPSVQGGLGGRGGPKGSGFATSTGSWIGRTGTTTRIWNASSTRGYDGRMGSTTPGRMYPMQGQGDQSQDRGGNFPVPGGVNPGGPMRGGQVQQ